MRSRFRRFAGLLVCGSCFQVVSCDAEKINEAVAENVKNFAIDITEIFIDLAVDNAFQLN